jgi:hypothetical protein
MAEQETARFDTINPGQDRVILTSTILGGRLKGTDGTDGDARYRAQWLADAFGATVVINNRITPEDIATCPKIFLLGIPKALDPKDYHVQAAADGREIAKIVATLHPKELISFDASAGASHRLAMLGSGTHPAPKIISLFDPNAMKIPVEGWPQSIRRLAALSQWASYQLLKERRRPPESRNHHPMKHMGPAPVGPQQEIPYFADVWSSDFAYDILHKMATRQLCPQSRIRLTVPEYTFSLSSSEAEEKIGRLSHIANQDGVNFNACIARGMYHSATDDPAVCVRLLHQAGVEYAAAA